MADQYPQCSITVRIYPGRWANSPLEGAASFRHKSMDGRCLSSCPFYRPGSCKIDEWMSDIDPMAFPPVEASEESPLEAASPRRSE